MAKKKKGSRKPSALHRNILKLIKEHSPGGITDGEMRLILGIPTDEMEQFKRRRRELNNFWYHIGSRREGRKHYYFYIGERATPKDAAQITRRMRTEVLYRAHARCQMCGRTVEQDGVKLEVDHIWPREWGGPTELWNLQSLCHECNHGKKDRYKDFGVGPDLMKDLAEIESVHIRIGELLKAFKGKPVPSELIEVVANQSEWRKRLRELRYPGVDWKIEAVQERRAGRRAKVGYRVVEHRPWPEDPTGLIRKYEEERATRNKEGEPYDS